MTGHVLYIFLHTPTGHRRNGRAVSSALATAQPNVAPSPLQSAHSHVTSTLPLLTLPRLHTTSYPVSRPSSLVHRVRRPSPPPSRETDADWDTTRNDGQKGDNADVKCKGAELARPAENESRTCVPPLPSEFTDSSRMSRISPPPFNSILESPPFSPTPTDPIPAEPQGPQSRVSNDLPLIPALKPDRRLPQVSLSIRAVASLSLGALSILRLTTRLASSREGLAIIVMSLLLSSSVFGSIVTGKSKKQLEGLNEKKNVSSRSTAKAESNSSTTMSRAISCYSCLAGSSLPIWFRSIEIICRCLGKWSLEYSRIRLVTILCSEYLVRRVETAHPARAFSDASGSGFGA